METLPQVKLADVARTAGVSIATASRALAGRGRVSPQTSRRVTEAARRLGYSADPIARALRAGSTRTIGMVVPVLSNPHFSELIAAVETELEQNGYELIVADSHGHTKQESKRLQTLVERRVDGLLVISHDAVRSGPALRSAMRAVPVVQIHRKVDHLAADFVGTDDRAAMRLIFDHLVGLGARRFVLASADDTNSAGRGRRQAFEAMIDELRLEADPHFLDEFSIDAGRRAADLMVARGSLPDAIVAGSDSNAIGIVSRLLHHGVRIPTDVRVTGFEGTALAAVFRPSITTVKEPIAVLARTAVANLLARIRDSSEPVKLTRIEAALVIGASTAPTVDQDNVPPPEPSAIQLPTRARVV